MKRTIKKWLLSGLAAISMLCCGLGMFVNLKPQTAAAQNNAFFSMETGASVKINSDGGIRFKVDFDESTKKRIVDNDTNDEVKLYFIIAPKSYFDKQTDGKYINLSKKVLVEVDESKIYQADGVWKANGCLTKILEQNRNLIFQSVAVIEDNSGLSTVYKYADNVADTARSMAYVLNEAITDPKETYASALLSNYTWLGGEEYPIEIRDAEDYQAFAAAVNRGVTFENEIVHMAHTVNQSAVAITGECKATIKTALNVKVEHKFAYEEDGTSVQDGTVLPFSGEQNVSATVANGEISTVLDNGEYSIGLDNFHETKNISVNNGVATGVDGDTLTLTRNIVSHNNSAGHYTATENENGGQLAFTGNVSTSFWGKNTIGRGLDYSNAYLQFDYSTASNSVTSYRFLAFGSEGNFFTVPTVVEGSPAASGNARLLLGAVTSAGACGTYFTGTANKVLSWGMTENDKTFIRFAMFFEDAGAGTKVTLYYISGGTTYNYLGYFVTSAPVDGLFNAHDSSDTDFAYSNVKGYDGAAATAMRAATIGATYTLDVKHAYLYENEAYAFADGEEITFTGEETVVGTVENGKVSVALHNGTYTVSAAGHPSKTLSVTDGVISTTELNFTRNVVTEKSATGYVATNTEHGGNVTYTNYQPNQEFTVGEGVDFNNAVLTFDLTFDAARTSSSLFYLQFLNKSGARSTVNSATSHNGTALTAVTANNGFISFQGWSAHTRVYVANANFNNNISKNIGSLKAGYSSNRFMLRFSANYTVDVYYWNGTTEQYEQLGQMVCAEISKLNFFGNAKETNTVVSNLKIYDGGRGASSPIEPTATTVSLQHKFAYEQDAYALANGTAVTLTAQDGTEIATTVLDGKISEVLENTVYTVSVENHKSAMLDLTDGVAEAIVFERSVVEEKAGTGYSATNGEYGGNIAYTSYKPAQEFAIGKGVDFNSAVMTFDLDFDSARGSSALLFLQLLTSSGGRATVTSAESNGTAISGASGYIGFNGYTVGGNMYNRVYIGGSGAANLMAVGSLKTSNPAVKIMLIFKEGTITVSYKNASSDYVEIGKMVVSNLAYLNIFGGGVETNTVISNLQIFDGERANDIFGAKSITLSVSHKFANETQAYTMEDTALTFTPISGMAAEQDALSAMMSEGTVTASLYTGEYEVTAGNHKATISVRNGKIVGGLTDGVLVLQRLAVNEIAGTGYLATNDENGGYIAYTNYQPAQKVILGEGVDLTNAVLTFDLDFDASRASSFLYLQPLNSSGVRATISSAEGNHNGAWTTVNGPVGLIGFNGFAKTALRIYTANANQSVTVNVGSLAADHPSGKIAIRFTNDGVEYTMKIYAQAANGEYGLVGVMNSPDIAKMNIFSSATEVNTVISNVEWLDGERAGQVTAFGWEDASVANYNLTGLHKVDVTESGKYLASAGANTGYNIVYGEEMDPSGTWAGVLGAYLYKSSGNTAIFSKVSETFYIDGGHIWNQDRKWVVVGSTAIAQQAGLSMPEGLGDTGYYIVSKGNSLFILANHTLGIRNGVYTFLDYTIGFDAFSADTVVYENMKDIPLYNFEVIEKPDFEYATASNFINYANVDEMRIQGLNEVFIPTNGKTFHNVFEFLNPDDYDKGGLGMYGNGSHSDWFSDTRSDREDGGSLWTKYPTNLCYTAHGDSNEYSLMVSTFTTKLVEFLNQTGYETHPAIMISVNDEYYMCDCTACTTAQTNYGANSGAMIKFMNDVSNALAAQTTRDVELVVLAYYESASLYAPVKNGVATITCNDNVSVMIAPIEGFFTKPLTDSANAEIATVIDAWSKVSGELYFYLYNTNFHYMLYPYDSFEAMSESYRFLMKYNTVCIYNQGQANQASPTAFNDLKQYVHSKLTWNVNYDLNEIYDMFFDSYYGEASGVMRTYFNALNAYMGTLNMTGSITETVNTSAYWSKETLNTWLGYINAAYEALDINDVNYDLYVKHIKQESIFIRMALIELYGVADDTFRTDVEALGITQYSESQTIADKMGW